MFLAYRYLKTLTKYKFIKLIYFYITETKETQLMYSQTTMTKKHGFSETDDSHFLFYFSAMTILSMLFYLALYNKKKVSI